MTLDEELESKGLVTITERLLCNGPMDGMMRHAGVQTLDDLLQWVVMTRRENMEMIARHDLEIHTMCEEVVDFVYGKSAALWEFHVNLLQVIKGIENGS